MKTIQLKEKDILNDETVDQWGGRFLNDSHYSILVQEDCKVLKPDGTPLLIFRKGVLSPAVCKAGFPALRRAAKKFGNRGMAAGIREGEIKVLTRPGVRASKGSSTRAKPIKLDGTVSNTSYAEFVPSGIIGYFDRSARFPYCRMTVFNLTSPEKFAAALPFIRAVDRVFQEECPERYEAQMEMVRKTSPDFVIHGTSFTTMTVNKNWATAQHQDAGDLKEGFGVMSAFRAGKYTGGYLVFPKYKVAVDLCTRDVLLADVHEWHGNTQIVGVKGAYERLSCVFYYREKMQYCGSAEEELNRVKTRKRGTKLNEESYNES